MAPKIQSGNARDLMRFIERGASIAGDGEVDCVWGAESYGNNFVRCRKLRLQKSVAVGGVRLVASSRMSGSIVFVWRKLAGVEPTRDAWRRTTGLKSVPSTGQD